MIEIVVYKSHYVDHHNIQKVKVSILDQVTFLID